MFSLRNHLFSQNANTLRLIFVAILLILLFLLYKLTLGLDRSSLPIAADGTINVGTAPWTIRLLNWFSSIQKLSDVDSVASNLTFFVSVAFSVVTAITSLLFDHSYKIRVNQLSSLFPVSSIPIEVVGVDDIAEMLKYYNNADFVTVFSGDFSWLSKDDAISKSVMELARSRKIKFYSSKSRNEVAEAIGSSNFHQYLPLIHFNSPANFKASLVEMQGGAQYLLYNRREANKKSEIIVFENRNSLDEPISKLSAFVRQTKRPTLVILVCGETGSGKTKVARQIHGAANAQLISVGDYFRNITEAAGKDHTSRNTVIGVGRDFLNRFGAEDLAKMLISRFDPSKDTVIIDGLRPPEAIEFIRARFPNHIVIYVNASENVRAGRCIDFKFSELDTSIDAMVRPVASSPSTVRIENDYFKLSDLEQAVENDIIKRFKYLSKY